MRFFLCTVYVWGKISRPVIKLTTMGFAASANDLFAPPPAKRRLVRGREEVDREKTVDHDSDDGGGGYGDDDGGRDGDEDEHLQRQLQGNPVRWHVCRHVLL